MMEKFYCVGCKNHHELEVLEATEQNGKGGSIRYSLRSVCPSGHKTNKLCKREIYEAYGAEVSEMAAEGMTVGVNLEALAPTADEPESGVALVPEDSLMPEGSGRTIGSQSVSHNYTPFHAEVAYAVSWEGKEDNNEGLIYGIEYTDEVGGVADVEWFSTAEERDEELTRYLEKYGAESNKDEDGNYISCPKCGYEPPVYEIGEEMPDGSIIKTEDEAHEETIFWLYENHPDYCPKGWNPDEEEMDAETFDAETFIAYPELKDHLVAVMPDKIYGVKVMDDGDFEMKVANRYMDEVISVVSDYQMNEESSDSSGFLGSGFSKTTVAVATATLAVGLAYYFNRK